MVFEMKLQHKPFEQVLQGKKTVELRLYDEKRRVLNIGDRIIFTNISDRNSKLAVRIMALYRFGNFEDLFSEIPPERCGFDQTTSISDAADRMYAYYSPEEIARHGVLGIGIVTCNLEETMTQSENDYLNMLEHFFPDGMK